MTEEIGSDAQLAAVADVSTLEDGVKEEQRANSEEESRLAAASPADDEPGEDFPEPEPPPHDEPHSEYDPMPPT
jgi:hypothetical protein